MSRIAVVLCVALFAAAADSAFNDTSDIAVGRVVKNVISKVESDMRRAHGQAEAEIEKVLSEAFKKADEFSEIIMKIVVKTEAALKRIYNDNIEHLTMECMSVSRPMWEIGGPQSRVMANANKCIIEVLKKGYSYMNGAGFLYAQGLANITSIKAEIEAGCSEMVDRYYATDVDSTNLKGEIDSFLTAQYCRETAAAKAYEVSVTVIPGLTTKMAWLAEWWQTASPKVDICTSNELLIELEKEMEALLKATRECFEANINLKKNKETDNGLKEKEEA